MRRLYPLLLLLFLVACARAGDAPVSPSALPATQAPATTTPIAPVVTTTATRRPAETQTPDDVAAASPSPTALLAPTTSPSPSPTSSPATAGHTTEGAYYLGDPAAPVTIIDYSDFM